MKIVLLGIASGMPTLGLHNAAVAVSVADRNLLLDCGEGTSHQLLRHRLDGDVIDDIIITHYHPDHVAGLLMTMQMLHLQKRSKPLTVYLPERVDEFPRYFDLTYDFLERYPLPVQFRAMESLNLDNPNVLPIPSDHLTGYRDYIREHELTNPMHSWSILVREESRTFLYTSDLKTTVSLQPYAAELDLTIIDGLHPTADDVLALAQSVPGRIGIIHGISAGLQSRMRECPNLFVAEENAKFDL